MTAFAFNSTSSILVGAGNINQLADQCANLGITKALIVTDAGIVSLGLHKAALESFNRAGLPCCVYSDVEADPTEGIVDTCLSYARSENIDGVIGLGGGSSMDVAKLIAVLKGSNQPLSEMYGIDQLKGKRLPLIQVPTTAGTGSEVTPISIITTGETTKAGIVSSQLLPDLALLDPMLTIGLPSHVTAATGIDAMVHAIEAYTSKIKKNPYSDMLAREALALLSANIEVAVKQGSNIEARAAMMLGATMAGQAFANAPVAAVHALAYPLGGHFHIPHGLSNSLVLPHVMRFNVSSVAGLYAELAPIIAPSISEKGIDDEKISENIIAYMEGLIADLGLPATLKSTGIEADHLPMLASAAMEQQRLLQNNPREVKLEDALSIYQAAFE